MFQKEKILEEMTSLKAAFDEAAASGVRGGSTLFEKLSARVTLGMDQVSVSSDNAVDTIYIVRDGCLCLRDFLQACAEQPPVPGFEMPGPKDIALWDNYAAKADGIIKLMVPGQGK